MTTKQIIFAVIGTILSITVLMFVTGVIDIAYTKTVGKEVKVTRANVDREVFKENKSFVEGNIQDLQNYKHQWTIAKSEDDKLAIETVIRDQFANFDQSKIDNPQLVSFLQTILNK